MGNRLAFMASMCIHPRPSSSAPTDSHRLVRRRHGFLQSTSRDDVLLPDQSQTTHQISQIEARFFTKKGKMLAKLIGLLLFGIIFNRCARSIESQKLVHSASRHCIPPGQASFGATAEWPWGTQPTRSCDPGLAFFKGKIMCFFSIFSLLCVRRMQYFHICLYIYIYIFRIFCSKFLFF